MTGETRHGSGALQVAFGRSLLIERRRRGLSQVQLGAVLGYHFGYLAAIERGQRNITLRTAEEIAVRLGLDPLSMLGGEPRPARPGSPSAGS